MRQYPPYRYQAPDPNPGKLSAKILAVILAGMVMIAALIGILLETSRPDPSPSATTEAPESAPLTDKELVDDYEEPPRSGQGRVVPSEPQTPLENPYYGAYTQVAGAMHEDSPEEWRAFARSLVGTHVAWRGTVVNLHNQRELWINNTPDQTAYPEVVLHLTKDATQSAGERVSYEGRIARINVIDDRVIVHLDNVVIK